jgi:hypothetical protein
MRLRWLLSLAALVFTGGFVSAEPAATGPTLEVRLRSVNDLLDKAEYVAGLGGKEETIKQVRELLKGLSADGKGIEGVDPKKPIGAYGTLEKAVETSPFVLFIPIADQEQFLKALNKHANIMPEKADDGTFKVSVPFINELNLRFANGYLYISQKAKDLDTKTLIKPAAFFAQDDGSVLSILLHIDHIPAELKTLALGQIELNINEKNKENAKNLNAAEKQLQKFGSDLALAGVKGLIDDGKDLSVKLFADPKSDDISAEVSFTPTSGSPTAKNFTSLAAKKSVPAGIVGAPVNPVARGNVAIAVTEGMKKDYAAAIDTLLADALKKTPAGQEEELKKIVAALTPALKAGDLDAAGAFIGPDAKGHYQVIGASAVKEGKGIEKVLKDLVKQHGQEIEGVVSIKFDAETIGDFALHRIDLKQTDDQFDRIFGTKTVWLATSDKYIAFSIEPNGDSIRKGLAAGAVPVSVVSVDVALAKVIPLVRPDLKPDEVKALLKEAFGDAGPTGKDTATVTIEGGQRLTAKFVVKGKALRMFSELEETKKR